MLTLYCRRWLVVVFLLFCVNASYGQALQKLEYFFDADPGFGNGTPINLNSNQLIDSTFYFDVSALSNGVHIVYIRAQDDAQKWSLYYSTTFVKTAGSDSALVIKKIEYFLDVDPGFGNGIDIPVQQANIIDSTFNFQIPDNGADTRRLYVRAQDSRGQWSLLYDYSINLCDLYKVRPNFSWVRFADLYSFIDSSTNNPTHNLLWNFDNLAIDSVSNPQFTFPQGNHSVKLIAGAGCRKDSVTIPLYVGLENYFPDTTYNGADMVINFYGGGLDTNLTVKIDNNAGTVISPYGKFSADSKVFSGIFDLHTSPAGTYDIKMHYSNGYDTTIVGGLHVYNHPANLTDSTYEPKVSILINGPHFVRAGETTYPQVIVTNESPVIAKYVNVWLLGDSLANYDFKPALKFDIPDTLKQYVSQIPEDTGIDTLDGKSFHSRAKNFIIPYLMPGSSVTIPLEELAPQVHGTTTRIYYWTSKSMVGSIRTNWIKCLRNVVNFALSTAGIFLPPVAIANCISQIGQFFLYNFAQYANDFYYGTISYKKLTYDIASTLLGCIPGTSAASVFKASQEVVKRIIIYWEGINYINGTASGIYGAGTEDCISINNDGVVKKDEKHYDQSRDPNEITGPQGFGEKNYISNKDRLDYRIEFENLPTATASAQRIYINDTLDKTKFDPSTFQLVGYTLADSFTSIPPHRKEFTKTIDLRPGKNLLLRFNAKFDTAQGILNYTYLSLDPVTRDTLPLADTRGFLPPDVNGINGKGSVTYVIDMKKGLLQEDKLSNRASIVFDNNPPIVTQTWTNTLDITAPSGSVTGGTMVNDTTVRLQFGGSDVGVGVGRYQVYGAEGNNPYLLLGEFKSDTVRFAGDKDSTYRFYAIPYDSVSNFSPKPPVAEYTISFAHALPVVLDRFYGEYNSGKDFLHFTIKEISDVKNIVIQRSADARSFKDVGSLPGNIITARGINNFTDDNPFTGNNYYRLKIINIDGNYSYSNVLLIRNTSTTGITFYPNPVKNTLLVKLDGVNPGKIVIQISDVTGRQLFSVPYFTDVNQQINISMSPYSKGIYIIAVKDITGRILAKQKIIKD